MGKEFFVSRKMFAEKTLDKSAGLCYNGSSLNENGDF